jgi:vanillate monooxygenase ferredoxin subunit
LQESALSRRVRVERKWQEAERIFGFELADPGGAPLPSFSAGSHIDVHVPGGLVRQYSLCRPASEDGHYEIAIQHEINSRGGSATLCANIQRGDLLEISDPRNHFPLEPAEHSLLLAGGIGITPLLCMAQRLSAQAASFELHYCTQSRARTAYLERIAAAPFSDKASFHFDDGEAAQRLDLSRVLGAASAGKHVYICGPAGFLEFVREQARQQGWASANVHFEYFSPPAQPQQTASDRFTVVIASSGLEVNVAEDEPVTVALARVGIEIPQSCEVGVCGTCLTRVLEGIPDHRDYFLSDAERATNKQFLPCCSRAKTPRLVLDL